jgi:hypothetical protein
MTSRSIRAGSVDVACVRILKIGICGLDGVPLVQNSYHRQCSGNRAANVIDASLDDVSDLLLF